MVCMHHSAEARNRILKDSCSSSFLKDLAQVRRCVCPVRKRHFIVSLESLMPFTTYAGNLVLDCERTTSPTWLKN